MGAGGRWGERARGTIAALEAAGRDPSWGDEEDEGGSIRSRLEVQVEVGDVERPLDLGGGTALVTEPKPPCPRCHEPMPAVKPGAPHGTKPKVCFECQQELLEIAASRQAAGTPLYQR